MRVFENVLGKFDVSSFFQGNCHYRQNDQHVSKIRKRPANSDTPRCMKSKHLRPFVEFLRIRVVVPGIVRHYAGASRSWQVDWTAATFKKEKNRIKKTERVYEENQIEEKESLQEKIGLAHVAWMHHNLL